MLLRSRTSSNDAVCLLARAARAWARLEVPERARGGAPERDHPNEKPGPRTTAETGNYSYSDIAIAPSNEQNLYIAGVADALARKNEITFCLGKTLKMKAGQLKTNVMAFAASRPALHSQAAGEGALQARSVSGARTSVVIYDSNA